MPSKTKKPRRHAVHAELTNVELVKAKSALRLQIFAQKEKLGEIQIGRGSIYWWGANRQKNKRIDWSKFARMMDELAYGND